MKTIIVVTIIVILALLAAYMAWKANQSEKELAMMKAREINTKTLQVSYTLTDSDFLSHKACKMGRVVRRILAKLMAEEIITHFQHMDKEVINGYPRYTYRFHIRQEYK